MGDCVGSLNTTINYWQFSYSNDDGQKTYYAHRAIWEMHRGSIPVGFQIDHIDTNRRNNKLGNLRLVTRKHNLRNSRKSSRNKSGITGVFETANYWAAFHTDLLGKPVKKYFSIKKLGYADAKEAAKSYRESQIIELNRHGANYTALHGK